MPMEQHKDDEEEILWRVLKNNQRGCVGIGLWLVQVAGLSLKEATDLKWHQVDFENRVLHLERGELAFGEDLLSVLENEKAQRSEDDDSHVILTPRSRKPMDEARLSTITRNILVHNGLAYLRGNDLRKSIQRAKIKEQIVCFAEAKGYITRQDVEEEFALNKSGAYEYLVELVDAGELVHTSKGYFPPSVIPPVESWPDVVIDHITENGSLTVEELATVLHSGKYSARRLLRQMTKAGTLKLIQNGKYQLFNSNKQLE